MWQPATWLYAVGTMRLEVRRRRIANTQNATVQTKERSANRTNSSVRTGEAAPVPEGRKVAIRDTAGSLAADSCAMVNQKFR